MSMSMSYPLMSGVDEPTSKRARIDSGTDGITTTIGGSSGGAAAAAAAFPSFAHPPQPHTPQASSTFPSSSSSSPPSLPSDVLRATPPAWINELPGFLDGLSDDQPTIPDEIVQYLLERAGCNCQDPKLVRLVSLATQHFLYDVMTDARQYQRLRQDKKDTNAELTLSDLSSALHQHGINVSKPEFIADTVFAGDMLNVNAALVVPQANLTGTAVKDGAKKDKEKKR